MPLHKVPDDPGYIDGGLGMAVQVRPTVAIVAHARDELVALQTVGQYLAAEAVPLLWGTNQI